MCRSTLTLTPNPDPNPNSNPHPDPDPDPNPNPHSVTHPKQVTVKHRLGVDDHDSWEELVAWLGLVTELGLGLGLGSGSGLGLGVSDRVRG